MVLFTSCHILRLLHFCSQFLQGSPEQLLNLLRLQFLQYNDSAPAEQGRVQLEGWVLRCCSQQGDGTILNVWEKRILMNVNCCYKH